MTRIFEAIPELGLTPLFFTTLCTRASHKKYGGVAKMTNMMYDEVSGQGHTSVSVVHRKVEKYFLGFYGRNADRLPSPLGGDWNGLTLWGFGSLPRPR